MCGELASRNAGSDLNRTSGKSEPVGLEGARRNPEIPPPTAFWHTPRERGDLMGHQMPKRKFLPTVREGTAGCAHEEVLTRSRASGIASDDDSSDGAVVYMFTRRSPTLDSALLLTVAPPGDQSASCGSQRTAEPTDDGRSTRMQTPPLK
ncbi:hypothetical protein E5288_WYG005862 [Bos mutus]|uniref:Uncharacterized protein n=1 Tax=Bos mutus TaxID=72004 RepID=A0A6B0QU41_9CETA|nr:hypothetical protein [Bos mutus]